MSVEIIKEEDAGVVMNYAGMASHSPKAELRRLLVLAAPIIATTVSRMAIGFTDFVMVSQLGTEAQAAISPSTILVFSVICLGMGMASSTTTFASQALGRGRPREAAAYAWQTLYMGAFFTLLAYPASRLAPLFWSLVNHEPAVQALEIAYCEVAFWSIGFAVMSSGLDGFFQGVQRPGVSLLAILVSFLFNLVANYLLVFGKFGFPEMGIRGSALATVLSWVIRAGLLSIVFLSPQFHRRFLSRDAWRPTLAHLTGVIRIGGPISVQWFLDIGSWFVFLAWIVPQYGKEAMAASNVVLQYMHLSFMPALGICIALTSLVGHAIGERKPELVWLRTRLSLWVTCSFMGLIGVLFFVARHPLMKLMSHDPAVVELGAAILIWAAVFQAFDAVGMIFMSALRGAGDTRWAAMLVVLDCWVVFIGGGLLCARLLPSLGVHGPWMACTAYIVVLGFLLGWRFMRGAWRDIDIFKEGPATPAGIPSVLPISDYETCPAIAVDPQEPTSAPGLPG